MEPWERLSIASQPQFSDSPRGVTPSLKDLGGPRGWTAQLPARREKPPTVISAPLKANAMPQTLPPSLGDIVTQLQKGPHHPLELITLFLYKPSLHQLPWHKGLMDLPERSAKLRRDLAGQHN